MNQKVGLFLNISMWILRSCENLRVQISQRIVDGDDNIFLHRLWWSVEAFKIQHKALNITSFKLLLYENLKDIQHGELIENGIVVPEIEVSGCNS